MKVQEITEYDHFVSFVLEGASGGRFHIQFRNDQVWQDKSGEWQILQGSAPFHVARLPHVSQTDVKVSPAMRQTLEKAIELA